MSKGILTQEEIDALLSGGSVDEDSSSGMLDETKSDTPAGHSTTLLSNDEIDVLGEIGNMSMGSAATVLSQLVNQKVNITTPTVSVVNMMDLHEEYTVPFLSVVINYIKGIEGSNLLVFDLMDAARIVDLLMGGNGLDVTTEFDEIKLSAISEIMNQMMGSSATSMSQLFKHRIDISPPNVNILNLENDSLSDVMHLSDTDIVRISFDMTVGDLINNKIMLMIPVQFAKDMVQSFLNAQMGIGSVASADAPPPPPPVQQQAPPPPPPVQQQAPPPPMEQQPMYAPQPQYQQPMYAQPPVANVPVQTVQFQPLQQVNIQPMPRNIDLILDVPMQVTVELGRTRKYIREILEFSKGSIVELDKLAGEPVDILVNGKPIAKGEVVVIDENFGVRVTEIISPVERVTNLQ